MTDSCRDDELTLQCGAVRLRRATQADDALLLGLLPGDFEHDPTWPREPGSTLDQHRQAWFASWLQQLRTSSSKEQTIVFVVELEGQTVGLQTLELEWDEGGPRAETTSFLTPTARGRGVGLAMRAAVLSLAFDHLGVVMARSAANQDNVASRRITEKLGYRHVGARPHPVAGLSRPIEEFELSSEQWAAQDHPEVLVSGPVRRIADRRP